MTAAVLNVNGVLKKTTEINYDDLKWLYKEFEKTYGKLPTTNDGKLKYNMPQQRIIKRILEEENITYNDFMNELGKVSHIRSDPSNYNHFLKRFIEISTEKGRALGINDLTNNSYGLPSAKWFVKYCPVSSVKSYDDFVLWCGFPSNNPRKDTQCIIDKLHCLEKSLGRPITEDDITQDNIGFSMIVIKRIWGTLSACKKELGLLETLPVQPKPFLYYKEKLDSILYRIKNDMKRNFITWKDIESPKYNPDKIEHKTFTKAFTRENIDIFGYIKTKGFMMNPSNFSFHYTFDDGERIVSSMEYDFSNFLKTELGLVYKKHYCRDVMYKTFLDYDQKSKMNCDYVFTIDTNTYYVEIAGIIHNINNDWESHTYKSQQEQNYQQKMIIKKTLLDKNSAKYLFLFPEDFINDEYKNKFSNLIKTNKNAAA